MRDAIADGHHDLRKALIACLLVFCFESMLGNQLSAAQHAESRLMLLWQWTMDRFVNKEPGAIEKGWKTVLLEGDILETLNALDLQVLLFIDNRTPEIHRYTVFLQNRVISTMPSQIPTLKLARKYWNLIKTRN